MKKRVLSLFLALTLCLTLLPTSAFAEGENSGIGSSATTTVEDGQTTAAGVPVEDGNSSNAGAAGEGNDQPADPESVNEGNGQSTNTGEGEQPNSETDTRTEIWCTSKPTLIQRSYDGTTDGSTIPLSMTFTDDGTNEIKLNEGTGFTAKKTFDSADAGRRTVTVEIELIGDAAAKYKLKTGEETFTIGGYIDKAYPDLTVSLSRTTCAVGEKLLPLLSVEDAPEGAAVTYYYTQYKTIAGDSEFEGSDAVPKIDENTAIDKLDEEGNNTYYVYARTAATQNYQEGMSNVLEFTVAEKVDPVVSVKTADGTETPYGSFVDAWTAAVASEGSTLKLLADGTLSGDNTDISKSITLDLNGYVLGSNGSLTVKNGAALTVKNAGAEKSEKPVKAGLYLTLLVEKGGSFTCTDGKIQYLGLQAAGTGDYAIQLAEGENHCTFGGFAQGDESATVGDLLKAAPGMALHGDNSGSDVRIERSTRISKDFNYFSFYVGPCSEHQIGEDGTCDYCGASYVASVTTNGGETNDYTSLGDALDAANDGDTVTLLSDVDLGETYVTIDKSITFDLNGKTLSSSKAWLDYGVLLVKDATVTVKNGTVKAAEMGSCAIRAYGSGASMTLEDVTATVTSDGSSVMVGDFGSAVIKSGDYQGLYVGAKSQVTLEGGTFRPYMDTITNENVKSIFWKVNETTDDTSRDCMELLGDGCVYVDETGTQVRTGGGFNTVVTVQQGTAIDAPVAKIGDVEYASLSKAINAVQNGGTITLLNDLDLGNGAVLQVGSPRKNFTIDLASHTLSADGDCLIMLHNGSQLTLKNGTLDGSRCTSYEGVLYISSNSGPKLTLENVTAKNVQRSVPLVYVTNGTVEFDGGTYTGGVLLKTDGNAVLKRGTFQKGTNDYSIKTEDSGKHLSDYLDGESLFWKYNAPLDLSNKTQTADEVTVRPCEHNWENGKCTVCQKVCDHGGKNGFDNNSATCPYCGAPAVAETALYNGEGNRLQRRFADLQTALDADRDGGATLKLLADVTGDYTIDGTQDTGLNLNGHSIKGTVTVKAAAGSNTTTLSNTKNTTTVSIDAVVAHRGANLAGSGKPAVIGELTLADGATWKNILNLKTLGYKVLNGDGTYKWYAPNDVKGSQLNNVIINSLPITSKTLNLKVDGKNLTGNSPKVERGTTVQLCASCNAKDVTVTFSILKTGETTPMTLTEPSYSGGKYTKDYSFDTIGEYTIYFTATKDGYSVTSSHKKLTVTKPNLSNAEITFPYGNEAAFNSVSATGVPMFVVTYNGTKLEENVDFVITRGASTYDVGPCTLTIKATDNGDYTGSKSAEWTVRPLKVAASVGDIIKTYDGTTDLPANAKITFKSADSYYTGTTLRLAKGTDYEVSNAHYDSADASETEKTVSFTIKLKNPGYVFEDDTTQKDFTLNGADFDDKTFQINKATAPMNNPIGTLNIINGTCQTYTYDFNNILPGLPGGKYGTISYGQADISLVSPSEYNYDASTAVSDRGVLTLAQFSAKDGKTTGKIGTVKVNVTTTNYADFQLKLVLYAVDQIKPEPDGTITATPITYGDALSKSTISGKMKDPTTGDDVKGTFTWTDGTIKPDANDRYDAEWTFTPAEGYEEYATATGTVTIKVNKATPTFTAPTAQENLTYTGQEQELITAGMTNHGTMQYSLTEKGTYSQDTPTGTDAGAYTVWYRVIGDANHNDTAPASVAVRIGKKPLTITGVTAASKPYDGTTNADITSVTFDNVTLKRDTDYNVTASFDYASVDSGKNVTATVTLMGQAAKNYALEQSSFPTTGSIIKAAAPDFTKETALTIVNGHEKTYTVTLPALPTLETPKEYGALTYEIGEIKLNDGYYTSGAKVENGELTLPIQKNDVETTGSVGTVTVVIKSANYEDITLTVNVSAKNRITPTGTPTLSKNAIIYGDALNTIALSGKLHDNVNNVDVDGTFEWVDGTHIPAVGNGTYAAEWIFEPTDTEKYLTVSGRSNITVEKARQYGKLSMAGYTYGKTPSTPTLTDQTGDLNAQVTYSYAAADSGSVQTWDISNPPALNAGTYRMYASIGDTDNYYGFEAVYCEFVVAKATPTYTVPTGLTAKYGQTLADVTLPDGWSWMDSSESVGGASTAAKTFQAKFTPKDTENYNTVENIELEVTVNKADGGNLKTVELEQKYTDASDHTYTPDWAGLPAGQDWTFSSEASIVLPKQDFAADGNLLTYAISGGKAGDKITLILKASCDNYEDFTITLNVTLTEKDDQKPLTITGNTSVIYGEKLTLTTTGGSGMGAVTYRIDNAISTGEATIDPNTGVLTPVKVGSVSVIATKAGDNNYNDVTSAPFVLMIKPATPTGEPKYTKITTSGKTLKDVTLTIEGSTLNPSDGKLEWVDDKGEPLPDDTTVKANTTYKWRFTPDDDNYTTLTGEVELYHKSSSGGDWYDSYYTIKATAGAGGSISPSGNVSVREGGDQTFTITPDKGYAVANVKIDGKSIGAVKSYTFESVSSPHTIEAIFVKGTASASTGDSSNLPLWSALLLASTLALASAVHLKRKRAR